MNAKRMETVFRVREFVRSRRLHPGEKLPTERELADLLALGRPLLREALITLEALGELEVRERQGIFVRRLPLEELTGSLESLLAWPKEMLPEMLEMRRVLELPAAELAALRRSEEDLRRMEECLEHMERLHLQDHREQGARDETDEAAQGSLWNTLFHTTLVQASGNRVLLRTYEGFSVVMGRITAHMRRFHVREPSRRWSHLIVEEHRRILLAIRNGDPETARKAMGTHLDETARVLYSLPEQPLFPGSEK
jgi:GntR family transcriptional repressor for pyruvate dehydrogenase complex